jgi:citrate lyase subunit beta/citryl-CoA lyase
VPDSSVKMPARRRGLPADQVFLDLEDAVAPLAKPEARKNVVAALNDGDWAGKARVVAVNDLTTPWTYRDVVEVVEGAGRTSTAIMLPKVQSAGQVQWLDLTLTQIEKTIGLQVGRSASRRRSRTPPAWSTSTRSPAPRRGSRRSSSARPTSWPRST